VTVKLKDAPAVAEEGMEERTRELAEAELTMMFEEVMEMAPSEAVRVWVPTDLRVARKEPTPLVRLAGAGSTASESEEAMPTEPV
jgi:hypothetical protein